MQKIKIFGVGGVTTNLLPFLGRHLNLRGDCRLYLVDGDEFQPRNANRQIFSVLGNKAEVKGDELAKQFPDLSVRSIGEFVTPKNIDSLIESGDVIILAVDNFATRKLVSDYCRKLDDIFLISGGNDLTDGNVQAYLRKGGKDVTRPITDFHPEIENPKDKSPGEMSCEERANQPGSDQILVANVGVAWLMYVAYWLFENGHTDKLGEMYFDILSDSVKVVNRRRSCNG